MSRDRVDGHCSAAAEFPAARHAIGCFAHLECKPAITRDVSATNMIRFFKRRFKSTFSARIARHLQSKCRPHQPFRLTTAHKWRLKRRHGPCVGNELSPAVCVAIRCLPSFTSPLLQKFTSQYLLKSHDSRARIAPCRSSRHFRQLSRPTWAD